MASPLNKRSNVIRTRYKTGNLKPKVYDENMVTLKNNVKQPIIPNSLPVQTRNTVTSSMIRKEKKGPVTRIVKNRVDVAKIVKQKSLSKKVCNSPKEFYPEKSKRCLTDKTIVLKPKHQLKVVATTNKRKRSIPQYSLRDVVKSPLIFKEYASQSSQGNQEHGVDEMMMMMECEQLDDEDLMEILTCPSPVWWEDPPDGYDEDAISLYTEEELKEGRSDKEIEVNIKNLNNDILKTVKVMDKEVKFKNKRAKLESVLGNIKNKAKVERDENYFNKSNSFEEKANGRNRKISTGGQSDSSINEEHLINTLESITIPVKDITNDTDVIIINDDENEITKGDKYKAKISNSDANICDKTKVKRVINTNKQKTIKKTRRKRATRSKIITTRIVIGKIVNEIDNKSNSASKHKHNKSITSLNDKVTRNMRSNEKNTKTKETLNYKSNETTANTKSTLNNEMKSLKPITNKGRTQKNEVNTLKAQVKPKKATNKITASNCDIQNTLTDTEIQYNNVTIKRKSNKLDKVPTVLPPLHKKPFFNTAPVDKSPKSTDSLSSKSIQSIVEIDSISDTNIKFLDDDDDGKESSSDIRNDEVTVYEILDKESEDLDKKIKCNLIPKRNQETENNCKLDEFYRTCKNSHRNKTPTGKNKVTESEYKANSELIGRHVLTNSQIKYCYKCSGVFDTEKCQYCMKLTKIRQKRVVSVL